MERTVRVSVSRPEGWLAAKVPVRLTTASWASVCSRIWLTGRGQEEDLGDGGCAAGNGVGGVGGGVEVEELAEDGAGAGAGIGGERQGVDLGNEGVVGIVGDDEGGLFGGGDFGGLGGRRSLRLRAGAGGRDRGAARGRCP